MNADLEEFDIAIVGAGIAGYTAAITASSEYDSKVALVESDEIGGVCLNKGCIPTKALISYARKYDYFKKMYSARILSSIDVFDGSCVASEIRKKIDSLKCSLRDRIEKERITIFSGRASLYDNNIVMISDRLGETNCIKASNIILATGTKNESVISQYNYNDCIWNTESVFSQKDILSFDSIVIVGAGVTGIEFADAFSMIGKKVTVLEINDRILSEFSENISNYLFSNLRKKSIDIICSAQIEEIIPEDDELLIRYKQKAKQRTQLLLCDKVLDTTGRTPNLDVIEHSEVNIKKSDGAIWVNSDYETSIERIFAIGDILPNGRLAYLASKEAEDVIKYIINKEHCPSIDIYPKNIFTTPEISCVGSSEDELIKKNIKYLIGRSAMSSCGKAVADDCSEGFITVFIDYRTHLVLGAELICENAAEISGLIYEYIIEEKKAENIINCIFSHPSLSEHIKNAVENALRNTSRE